MRAVHIAVAILGLALLMVVHEAGHYLAARKFGMRVTKFSIGFGPTLWKHRPVDSPTVFQVALIPFLAYVQITGMNPYEESDPNDAGSYANASLLGRIVTISAGSIFNYVFASVLFFFGFLIGGRAISDEASMRIMVAPEGPAAAAHILNGDKVLAINDETVADWDALKKAVSRRKGETIQVKVERGGEQLSLPVTPLAQGEHEGKILIGPETKTVPMTVGEAAIECVKAPPAVVYNSVRGVARWIAGKEKAEIAGPVNIVRTTADAVRDGAGEWLKLLAGISAYLGAFNLLPFPALDGGRLLFLVAEGASRKKPDAKVEAYIHAVGLVMMLTLMVVVTVKEILFR